MSYKVEKVAGPHELGEGPHWDDAQQALFYVDATVSSICRLKDGKLTTCKLDEKAVVSIIIPMKDKPNKFLVTIGPNVTEVTWDGESCTPENIRIIATVNGLGREGNRFNDGKIDPQGRLWVGTMSNINSEGKFDEGVGDLFSVSQDGTIKKHAEGITVANGLAWTSDSKVFYYIDTPTLRVDGFDFDASSGLISNRRTVYDFSANKEVSADLGGPDGMTIDTEGNLWVAVFGAGGVYNINPRTGKLIRRIDIPSPQTTSVAFGGTNRDELYVTSANLLPDDVRAKFPDAGCTFKVTGLGVRSDSAAAADFS